MHNTAIALSGGADSLMSLLLLRETGARVLGVHARFMDTDDADQLERLRSLCGDLGVPLHLVDLRAEFEELVIAPFVRAYQAGLTPNPCAACNPAIKFGLLLDRARALGADQHAHVAGKVLVIEHLLVGGRDVVPGEDFRQAGVDAAVDDQLVGGAGLHQVGEVAALDPLLADRKSTRLNSSH